MHLGVLGTNIWIHNEDFTLHVLIHIRIHLAANELYQFIVSERATIQRKKTD